MINLGQKGYSQPVSDKKIHYPEISILRKQVKNHKQGETHHAKVKLHLVSTDEDNNRYAVHSVDFGKSPAKNVNDAVDNAADEVESEKDNIGDEKE